MIMSSSNLRFVPLLRDTCPLVLQFFSALLDPIYAAAAEGCDGKKEEVLFEKKRGGRIGYITRLARGGVTQRDWSTVRAESAPEHLSVYSMPVSVRGHGDHG